MNIFTTDNSSNLSFRYPSSASFFNARQFPFIEITETLEDLRSSREALLATRFVLGECEYILPVECDRATDISNRIKKVSEKALGKLKSVNRIQALSNSQYYKLLMHLSSASTKARRLNDALGKFRSVCAEPAARQRRFFIAAQKEISAIIYVCEQIELETEKLFDELLTAM